MYFCNQESTTIENKKGTLEKKGQSSSSYEENNYNYMKTKEVFGMK